MARKNCGENWIVVFVSVRLTSGVPSTHLDVQHFFFFFCISVTIKASSGGAQGLNIAINFGSGQHRSKITQNTRGFFFVCFTPLPGNVDEIINFKNCCYIKHPSQRFLRM